jgi:hypothetical protein
MSCVKCAVLEAQVKLQNEVIGDLIRGMEIMTVNARVMFQLCQPIIKEEPEAA